MSIIDPDSDIAVTARRDKNASLALPEAIRIVVSFNTSSDRMPTDAANIAYRIADAMEAERNTPH